ncbi:HAMP domain-containing sensor histidine kinase [Arcobacter peruensis]|uniref:HAMP domain-containing sensor histidine kinase n=1 Tax=Arcobacter peruensis TaxID=2320140 RepID=UPI000F07D8B7|nr:HAMP domain-containing sensor histidine kinase [Arcobacter peruensis]
MRNSINFLSNFVKYYNSLSILKKFLIPSLLGFMFFLLFYIYILSNTTYMKEKIHEINTQTIPLYETIFDNEFLLQKISHELQSAVSADELELIKDTNIYANKFRKNLERIKKSSSTNKLIHIENAFNNYYKEASNLAKDMIINKDDYLYLHKKTQLVVNKYNKLLDLFQKSRKEIKEEIKFNVTSVYSVSSEILFGSSLAFTLWMILSILGLLYVYKDMKSRIKQIVEESENIASGKANFHKRLSSISSDELGLVVNSINTFISKLEKNHHELEDARDDIKRFIADTVHQIRTPLSSILINAEMIRDSQKDDSLTVFVDSIDASINMLSNSYEDLSYVTSYDSIQYKANVLKLSNLVEKRIDFFGTICKMNLKEIESNIEKNLETFINTVECERIIDNNIANAIKYADIEKPIYINLSKVDSSNKIILEFKSFAKEIKDKNKIFEKNYREEDSKRGLGLGLNIVKNICDKYNILYKASYNDNQNIFTYVFEEI